MGVRGTTMARAYEIVYEYIIDTISPRRRTEDDLIGFFRTLYLNLIRISLLAYFVYLIYEVAQKNVTVILERQTLSSARIPDVYFMISEDANRSCTVTEQTGTVNR
jgi:hypothetical protein